MGPQILSAVQAVVGRNPDCLLPDNHSITIMDFKERRDEAKQKDYIDTNLLAFNVKLIDLNDFQG